MNKKTYLLFKILSFVFTVLLGLALIAGIICGNHSSAINSYFHISTQKKITSSDAQKKNTDYYRSSFQSVDEVLESGKKYCRASMEEGAVLLKNEAVSVDGAFIPALPLPDGAGVSLFSASSVYPVLCGTGSSSANKTGAGNRILYDGFESAGLSVNKKLYDWYIQNVGKYGRVENNSLSGKQNEINDAPWSVIPDSVKLIDDYSDAAIFIVSRTGGEGLDLPRSTGDKTDMTDGDYLVLSPTERDILTNLKAQKDSGKFKRIVVLVNSAYHVTGFINDEQYGIDAALWVGSIGSSGAEAIGNILSGIVSPSGRLSDTYYTANAANPASYNFGRCSYPNPNSRQASNTGSAYLVYQEGIYVGYRYTETRYTDCVSGRAKTGAFDYYGAVEYPFGYGLSYTAFDYSDMSVSFDKSKDRYTVKVKVTNTGNASGKEVVQIYLQKPYTPYDAENGVEKAAAELVGFAKTSLLKKGESETVAAEIDGRDFASYDSYGKGTYILDEGKYYLTAGKDAHDAANNFLAFDGKTQDDGIVFRGNTGKGDAGLVKLARTVSARDEATYSRARVTRKVISNQFDNADLKLYEKGNANANAFSYLSRSDWAGTMPTQSVQITRTDQMNEDYRLSQGAGIEQDDVAYPTYGADNGLKLIDLRAYSDGDDDPTNDVPIEYDNEQWEKLLDQLTWEETVAILSDGLRKTSGISSIGKPETLDHNGANGIINPFNIGQYGLATLLGDENAGANPVVYPCNAIVASTFNLELINEYGEQWGEDCLWSGYNALYGPGLNIHRSQYNGRNFEYFGEDPYLTGKSVAEISKGMATRGAYVYLKHCVLNDQETWRHGVNTWANEQTIREIYLKPFQIAIEEGGAACIMTAFNCIGAVWSGAQGFMKEVVYGEFGMTGHSVSDFLKDYMDLPTGVLNGNALPDGQRSGNFRDYETGYGEVAWAMRESVHRILYTVVHSNAMNGIDADTLFVQVTPAWQIATIVLPIVLGAGLAVSSGGLIWQIIAGYRRKRE